MSSGSKVSGGDGNRRVARVVGAGLIALDVVVLNDSKYRFYAGGTCGNVLAILGYLGWDAVGIARLAEEPATRRVIEDLRKWNVRTDLLGIGNRTRPPIIIHRITRAADGTARHRFSLTCPDCGEWLPQYRPVSTAAVDAIMPKLNGADVYFFDRISRATVDLARKMKAEGAVVMLEPSGVGDQRLFAEALEFVDVLKYAEDRIRELPEFRPPRPLLEVQTLGDEGLRYRITDDDATWRLLPAITASKLIDAAGCGDWTSAGFLHALATEKRLDNEALFERRHVEAALRFGQALATWNCGFEGARGGMYAVSKAEFWRMVDLIFQGAPTTGSRLTKRSAAHRALVASLCAACSESSAVVEFPPATLRRDSRAAATKLVHNLPDAHK